MADMFTVPMNLSGIPAISVPTGMSSKKLPIGMQFAANNFEENKLFSICKFISNKNKVIRQK
jgi:aspartyl-tRNA(Asn)/glutamyl-tRNA(Gln) amidotransferase subunit A